MPCGLGSARARQHELAKARSSTVSCTTLEEVAHESVGTCESCAMQKTALVTQKRSSSGQTLSSRRTDQAMNCRPVLQRCVEVRGDHLVVERWVRRLMPHATRAHSGDPSEREGRHDGRHLQDEDLQRPCCYDWKCANCYQRAKQNSFC